MSDRVYGCCKEREGSQFLIEPVSYRHVRLILVDVHRYNIPPKPTVKMIAITNPPRTSLQAIVQGVAKPHFVVVMTQYVWGESWAAVV